MTDTVPCQGGFWQTGLTPQEGARCSVCKLGVDQHDRRPTPLLLILREALARNLAFNHDIKSLTCRSCGARTALGKKIECKLKHPSHGHMPLSSPPCIVDGLTYESATLALK